MQTLEKISSIIFATFEEPEDLTKDIYFGQLGKILWVRLHSFMLSTLMTIHEMTTLTLNLEELQWLGILSKTQLDDDIKSDKAGAATSTSRDFEFKTFFFPKLLLSINQRCALTRRFYVQPKKYLGFCLDHFDSHARKLTSFLDDVTIFFLDQKSHLFSIFHPYSVLVSTNF